jgi:hypothetical protein
LPLRVFRVPAKTASRPSGRLFFVCAKRELGFENTAIAVNGRFKSGKKLMSQAALHLA